VKGGEASETIAYFLSLRRMSYSRGGLISGSWSSGLRCFKFDKTFCVHEVGYHNSAKQHHFRFIPLS
jgi:hypothetical protein